MGTVRTLLAISVVFAHTPLLYVFVGGQLAVQVFYCISGFLITYILCTVPAYANARRFYENRFLRLYPVYWTVALLSACLIVVLLLAHPKSAPDWVGFRHLPAYAKLVVIGANLLIVGQDWLMFAPIKAHPELWALLLVPPAWTLGVELSFYAIAPVVVRSVRVVIGLFIFSCALRAIGISYGLTHDPWTYRFFPFELRLFLLGSLSFHVWDRLQRRGLVLSARMQKIFYAATLLWIIAFRWLHTPSQLLLIWTFAALPFLFLFQQQHRFDSRIGELSYPIYIGHLFIITMAGSARGVMHALGLAFLEQPVPFSVGCALVSIGFAYLLKVLVADKMDRLRNMVRSGSGKGSRAYAATAGLTKA